MRREILWAAAWMTAASSAIAQDDVSSPIETVTVTGSRIARAQDVTPSPVVSVPQDLLSSTGAVTIETALNQLPQFGLGGNQAVAGFSGTGLATLNLRGLGNYRNLVLVDGRRPQPSTILQVIDINTIPKALIQDIEIISGGASAVYGSDAISGVVNLKLNPRFEGVQLDTQYNLTEEGDGATQDVSLTVGGNFADDRGNAVVSVSYTDREAVDFQSRDFFRRAQGGTDFRLPTGIYSPGQNQPTLAALDSVFAQYGVAAGAVPRNSRIGFNQDQTLFSASNGPDNYRGPSSLLYNNGSQLNNLNQFSIIQVPLERYTLFGKGTYDLSPAVSTYLQFNFSKHETTTIAEAGNNAISVPVTNPFISDDLAALLASRTQPNAPFTLDKRYQGEAGPRVFNRDFDVYQLLAGLQGDVDFLEGSWDVYASRGRTTLLERNPGSVLISSLNTLVNAPDGGASLCEGGYNPFGVSTLSASCQSFLVATPKSETVIDQDVVEATFQGRLFTWAPGDVRFAVGSGYRRSEYGFEPDRELAIGNVVGVFRTEASIGSTEVYEVYAEVLAPILADKPFAKSLQLGLAYRFSDYDTAGGVDAYKADLNWALNDVFNIRGGYQRAVRAASVGELYVAPNVAIPGIGQVASGGGDPCDFRSQARAGTDSAGVRSICLEQGVPLGLYDTFDNLQQEVLATNVGNPALNPESADTYTFGVLLRSISDSPWLRDLSVSVDYYDIRLQGAISTITAPQSIPKCFNRDGSNPTLDPENFFCQQITRNPVTGVFLDVNQPTLNIGAYETAGVDLALNWNVGLDALGVDAESATLGLRSYVTYLDSFRVQTTINGAFAEYGGTVGSPTASAPGSLPEWKAVTDLHLDTRQLGAGVRWRFVDSMLDSSLATNPASTSPGVGAYHLFDLFGHWDINESVRLQGGVNNVEDREPPIVRGVPGNTETSTYDIYGRSYYLALSARF